MSDITRIQVSGESAYEIVVGRALLKQVAEAIGDKAKKVLVVHPVALSQSAEQNLSELIGDELNNVALVEDSSTVARPRPPDRRRRSVSAPSAAASRRTTPGCSVGKDGVTKRVMVKLQGAGLARVGQR